MTVTTVTSGTEFVFGLSTAQIDFGEGGSSYRAVEALRGLRAAGQSAGRIVFTDVTSDPSGYLTREMLEEEFSS